jgi:hypothetical protein
MKKILPYNIHKKVKKIGQNILWEKTNRKQICDALYFDLSKKFNENVESISDILHMDMKKKWNLNV